MAQGYRAIASADTVILLLDNYDSFVHNLARYLRRLGQPTEVIRSDAIDTAGIAALSPDVIVISPGPCTPTEAGCSVDVVREFTGRIPVLGVCLGHQAIGAAFGASIVRAFEPRHGRTSEVFHDGSAIYANIPSPVTVCRYHSLVVDESTLPPELQVTGRTEDGVVMSIQHRRELVVGLQFHPESILTNHGYRLLANFLHLAGLPVDGDQIPSLRESTPTSTTVWTEPDRPLTF